MTVSTTTNKVSSTGNGVTTLFGFAIPFIAASDLQVYVAGAITTDYTISGSAPYPTGANVTFVSAPANGASVIIVRTRPYTQTLDLVANDPLPADAVEQLLGDHNVMLAQQLKEITDRSFTLPITDTSGASLSIPTPVASAYLGWNASANALVNYTGLASASVSAAMTPVVGAATLAAARTAMAVPGLADNNNFTNAVKLNGAALINKVFTQPFTSSGTYTPTTGMVYAIIDCWGAGAAGGSVAGNATGFGGGGGGGGGGYSRKVVTAADIGASKAVTIGAAGAAGAAGNNPGGNGGDTSVGSLCIGKGGTGGSGSNGNVPSLGGAGGVAGTGDVTLTGATGGTGSGANITTVYGIGGQGANSAVGGGGTAPFVGNGVIAGNAATGFAAGGAGAASNGNAGTAVGGVGTKGLVIITEFVSA